MIGKKGKISKKMKFDVKVTPLLVSVVLTYVLIVLSIIIVRFDLSQLPPYILVSIFFGMSPIFFGKYMRYKKLKAMEEIFPEFLRGLAEAQRSGINLPQAIINASKVDYGALNDEIKKMAYQLSWGVPLPRVLKMFSDRVKDSDFLRRSLAIIIEAYKTGGNIAEVMERVAENARILKDLEAERKARFNQQVSIMYAIFFIFIAIILALNKILVPLFAISSSPEAQGTAVFGFTFGSLDPQQFREIFLHMMILQSIFAGLIAGVVGEGSPIAGIKHSMIMLTISLIAFTIFLPKNMLIVNIEEPYDVFEPNETYELRGYVVDSQKMPVQGATVEIHLGNSTYTTSTDETGEFNQVVVMPQSPGTYIAEIVIRAKNMETKKKVTFVVGD